MFFVIFFGNFFYPEILSNPQNSSSREKILLFADSLSLSLKLTHSFIVNIWTASNLLAYVG